MPFAEVSTDIIGLFEEIVGAEHVIVDPEQRYNYSHDETEDYSFLPDVVLRPGTTDEVSRIMRVCNEHSLPVTPRGGGTGLAGAALPKVLNLVPYLEYVCDVQLRAMATGAPVRVLDDAEIAEVGRLLSGYGQQASGKG